MIDPGGHQGAFTRPAEPSDVVTRSEATSARCRVVVSDRGDGSTAVRDGILATLCFVLIAVVLGLPVLRRQAALGPDRMLDFDPLYGSARPLDAPLPTMNDPTPIALDWPRDLAIAHGLRQGRVDLWNPLAACGTPLWAELGGPFFPLKLPFYLFPSRLTYELFLLTRLAFAALGAYLLARRRGLGWIGAIAAGATFELCSPLMYQVRFGVYSNTFVLPWVLFGAEVLARRPGAPAAAGAGILLGLAASAGHAGIAVLVVGAFVVAMLMHVAARRRDPRVARSCLLWGALSLVVGLCLAAPTLLPTAELMTVASSYKDEASGQTLRSEIVSGWRVLLPPLLFLPGFAEGISLLGLLPVVAAMIGILSGGLDAPLLAVGFLGLLVAAPPIGLGWVSDLPVVRLILPFYGLPLVALPLSQAAGRGVEVLTAVPARVLGLAAVAPILLCLALWLVCAPGAGLALAVTLAKTPLPWLIPAVTVLLTAVALAARRSRVAWFVAPAMTILIICERLIANAPQLRQPTSEVLASPPSPPVRFLQDRLADGTGRMIGVPHRVGYPVTPMLFGLADVRGFAALPLRRYADYLRAVDVAAPPARRAPPSDMASSMVVQHVRVPLSPLLDLASARWLAVSRRSETPGSALDDDPALRLALDDGQVLLYENLAAVPRVRIVHRTAAVADENAARERVRGIGALTGHANELDLADMVVIEPDEDGVFPVVEPARAPDREAVWITEQSDPDGMAIVAQVESPGLVVITDTYAPGWYAWVDGTPTPIHPADLMFRAVPVPPGLHRIELRYRPRGFIAGVALFAVAAGWCALVFVLVAAKRRSPGWVSR
jgi:hypothetical protein